MILHHDSPTPALKTADGKLRGDQPPWLLGSGRPLEEHRRAVGDEGALLARTQRKPPVLLPVSGAPNPGFSRSAAQRIFTLPSR
jgi:hypothetical protein